MKVEKDLTYSEAKKRVYENLMHINVNRRPISIKSYVFSRELNENEKIGMKELFNNYNWSSHITKNSYMILIGDGDSDMVKFGINTWVINTFVKNYM